MCLGSILVMPLQPGNYCWFPEGFSSAIEAVNFSVSMEEKSFW